MEIVKICKQCNQVKSLSEFKTNKSYKVNLGGSATGDVVNGLYTNETYSGGTTYTTFTQSSVATSLGNSMSMPGGRR